MSLILTLQLDPESFGVFDQLRQQHFPPERNFLPAHITLFHALPRDEEDSIRQTLQRLCAATSVLPLTFPNLRFLGQGVAVEIDCPPLVHLHRQLQEGWQAWLTRQDQQRYRPHITIQNKVTGAGARALYDDLNRNWRSFHGQGEGLLLWYYQGGPWGLAGEFPFHS